MKSGNAAVKQETVPATIQRSDSGNNIMKIPVAMEHEASQRKAQARNLIRQEVSRFNTPFLITISLTVPLLTMTDSLLGPMIKTLELPSKL